jgi:hypothetical protein
LFRIFSIRSLPPLSRLLWISWFHLNHLIILLWLLLIRFPLIFRLPIVSRVPKKLGFRRSLLAWGTSSILPLGIAFIRALVGRVSGVGLSAVPGIWVLASGATLVGVFGVISVFGALMVRVGAILHIVVLLIGALAINVSLIGLGATVSWLPVKRVSLARFVALCFIGLGTIRVSIIRGGAIWMPIVISLLGVRSPILLDQILMLVGGLFVLRWVLLDGLLVSEQRVATCISRQTLHRILARFDTDLHIHVFDLAPAHLCLDALVIDRDVRVGVGES